MTFARTWEGWVAALVVAVSLVSLGAGVALADTPPSRWDRAENPDEADTWDLHVSVTRATTIARLRTTSASDAERIRERVRTMLNDALKAPNPNPVLRYDLGEVDTRLDHFGEAIEVLEPALAQAGEDDPASERPWNAIATAPTLRVTASPAQSMIMRVVSGVRAHGAKCTKPNPKYVRLIRSIPQARIVAASPCPPTSWSTVANSQSFFISPPCMRPPRYHEATKVTYHEATKMR